MKIFHEIYNYKILLFANLLSGITNLVAFKVILSYNDEQTFQEVVLLYRYSSFLSLCIAFGSSITIVKWAAKYQNVKIFAYAYFLYALTFLLVLANIKILNLNFPKLGYTTFLVHSTMLSLYIVTFSLYRGFEKPEKFRLPFIVCALIIPLLLLILFRNTSLYVWSQSILGIFCSIAFLIVLNNSKQRTSAKATPGFLKFLYASAIRFPLDISYVAVFTISVYYSNLCYSSYAATKYSLFFSLTTASAIFVTPFSTLLLPKLNLATNNNDNIKTLKQYIIYSLLFTPISISIVFVGVMIYKIQLTVADCFILPLLNASYVLFIVTRPVGETYANPFKLFIFPIILYVALLISDQYFFNNHIFVLISVIVYLLTFTGFCLYLSTKMSLTLAKSGKGS